MPHAQSMDKSRNTLLYILGIVFIFVVASLYLFTLSKWLPPLTASMDPNSTEANQGMKSELNFPTSLEELKSLANLLREYKKQHFGYVVVLFCSAYLYKQTFAIPGSVFLNLLAGAQFGIWIGFPLVCILTACGATFCFLISKTFGRTLLVQYFPERIKALQNKVTENLDQLFFFLLFLRIFPMSPNWFLNMASPILDVPITPFFFSVMIGLMPYNFICCQTGCILSELNSLDDLFSVSLFLKLGLMAFAVLIPSFVIKKVHKKHANMD